ncbi:MAG: DUF3473 domain-containing protein [Burkholderiaceae bacterium]
MAAPKQVHALTVDVEDYFQVSALAPYIPRQTWPSIQSRVEANVDRLLAMFDEAGARATFFTLGSVAVRHPALVRRIADAGHEVASHGFDHWRATDQTPEQFLSDIVRARNLLEDLVGQPVIGYRAPSFSIGSQSQWAFDQLRAAGYRYSSSVYPVRHDHYGMPDAPRTRFLSRPGLVELPLPTVRRMGRNLPAGGGGYFRLLPYGLSRWLLSGYSKETGQPAIFYFHPWEIDPEQPRVPDVDAKTRLRHYINLDRTQGRLKRLLRDFEWNRIDRLFVVDAG